MRFERLSLSPTLPRRAVALALVGLAAMACSDDDAADTLAGPGLAESGPSSVVTHEEAALFEAPAGTFTAPWGTATIKRGPQGIQAQLRVTDPDLQASLAGHAITLWVGSFAHPEECADPPVGAPDTCSGGRGDLADPDVGGARQIAGGRVLGDGPITVTVNVREGDTSNQDRGTAEGLQNPEGAEIHVVIRSHGPPIPGLVAEQISTVGGGCDVNGCSNAAVAIFRK